MTARRAAAARIWFDPALPFAEYRQASDSGAAYLPHTHPTLSVGAVDSGGSVFQWDGGMARLAPGAVVVVPADRVHACNPLPDGRWGYQMLHLDARWTRAVLAEIAADGGAPERLAEVGVRRDAASYRALGTLREQLFAPADAEAKEAALVGLVGDLFAGRYAGACRPAAGAAAQSEAGAGGHGPRLSAVRLARLKALLQARHTERLPLAELAREAGLSRYHLIRAFRAETGMTPHAYQLDQRINHARQLLRAGGALADVAQLLGFADQSHFQRAFKQRVAMTPRAYQLGQGRTAADAARAPRSAGAAAPGCGFA